MGRLLGYMANRADRLGEVLREEATSLTPPDDFRADAWGMGFYQGGEVLFKKRPQAEDSPIDWAKIAGDVRSDCLIVHLRKASAGNFRAENTYPFRMGRWVFAQTGEVEGFDAIRPALFETLPDFLRRNIRGSSDAEHVFHVLLSFLHDEGVLEMPDAEPKPIFSALRSTMALIARHAEQVKAPAPKLNLMLTNGRSLFAMRGGDPLQFVERSGSEPRGGGSFRYVLVYSNGEHAAVGAEDIPESSVLVVDRDLTATVHPLT